MPTVPLRSKRRRRALAVQKFQHVVPAVPLLFGGMHALGEGATGFPFLLALFEIGTSVLLLGSVVREVRAVRSNRVHATHGSHGIDWFDVFAAGVLVAEAVEHWHATHHWQRPTLLMAALTLALGLLHGRINAYSERRRSLRVEETGLYVAGRPFSAFRATWPEISAIEVSERQAVIRRRDGRERRIDLTDCEDPAAVRTVLQEAQTRLVPE